MTAIQQLSSSSARQKSRTFLLRLFKPSIKSPSSRMNINEASPEALAQHRAMIVNLEQCGLVSPEVLQRFDKSVARVGSATLFYERFMSSLSCAGRL